MKKIVEINECYINLNTLSFIGQIDTRPNPALNSITFALPLIVDGHKIDLIFYKKKDAKSSRLILIDELGATIKPEMQGFTP